MAQSTRSTRQSRARKSSGKSTKRSAAKRSAASRSKPRASRKQSNVASAARKARGPALAAGATAVAVAGGALLRRQLSRKRSGLDLKGVVKGISSAG